MTKWWCGCLLVLGLTAGCGDDEASGGGVTGGAPSDGGSANDGGAGAGGSSEGGSNEGGGGAAPATARLRAVHLSPGAPAVDFCMIADQGAAIGPVLAASMPGGLAYPGATAYLDVPPGSYTVRVLLAGASDCATPVLPDADPIEVSADSSYSVAAIGMVAPEGDDAPFELALFEDDNTVESGKVRMRFIHTSPDTPPVDVGLGSGDNFTPVWTNVAYPDIGLVAGEAYLAIDPPQNAQISARATGTTVDALVIDGVSIPPGEVVTSFAIGNLDGDPAPLKVLACLDIAGFCLELPAG